MEMELIKNSIASYNVTKDIISMHEESLDSIVPDTLPDIEAIQCCFGTIEIKEKVAQTDRIMVSGSIRATVVYDEENCETPVCLSANIPFAALVDFKGCKSTDIVSVSARLQKMEGCILNPRKYLIRAAFTICAKVYSKCDCDVCTGAKCEPSDGAQMLIENHTFKMISCVREKTLSIHEDIQTHGSCTPSDKILTSSASFVTEDVRVVSNKIMLRGSVKNDVLILLADGTTLRQAFALPYSQIIELEAAEANDDAEVSCNLRVCNVQLAQSDAGVIIKCEIIADVLVCVMREVTLPILRDGFSTVCSTTISQSSLTLGASSEKYSCTADIKQKLEVDNEAKTLIDYCVSASDVTENDNQACAVIAVTASYTSVDGKINQTHATIDAKAPMPSACVDCFNITANTSDTSVICSDGGLVLVGNIDFDIVSKTSCPIMQVSAWEKGDALHAASQKAPSLILRRVKSDETVWQLARNYSTSVAQIRAANRIAEGDAIAAGSLVMIPFTKK